ncbi:MAG: PTS sugar transporter subunit IIA [Desulfobacterales bacterium]|nr:PTS sugar transporter subunit IIA [Desulfobacterales bacterium]
MELSIQQVAIRLGMPVETLQRWVRQGKIPMQHSRGGYFIRLEMLRRWAADHQLHLVEEAPALVAQAEAPDAEGILPAMGRGGVFSGVSVGTKEQALQAAVDLIPNLEQVERQAVLVKLLEREGLASTGIGHGIALPHPRSDPGIALALPQITTCFLSRPVDFDAVDGRPVSVLMVMLSGSTRLHLNLLSKISFRLRNRAFRELLLTAPPAEVLLERVAQLEAEASDNKS